MQDLLKAKSLNLKPVFFDAHTHLNMIGVDPLTLLGASWREVGKRTIENGTWFINVGADEKSSRLALEQVKELAKLAPRVPAEASAKAGSLGGVWGCWATVGIHPTEKINDGDFASISELAKDEKTVAIGECGLEYYEMQNLKIEEIKKKQKELFKNHIELALEVNKPLMIHCRATLNNTKQNDGSPLVTDAHEDVLKILREFKKNFGDKLRFNMHFFTGTPEIAKKFIELDSYFSFNGVITFTNQYDEVARLIPLDRLMSETDAPFVAPVPYRGTRNEPAFVQYVAERLVDLRPEPRAEVLSALVANAKRFYHLS